MTTMQSNTFAEACYNTNSMQELIEALNSPADETSMKDWGLTEDQYFEQVKIAINEKKSDDE